MGFINDSIYKLEFNNIFSENNLTEDDFKNKMEEYLVKLGY